MSASPFVLVAVGDVMLLHPVTDAMTAPAAAALLDLVRGADIAVANFEMCAFEPDAPGPVPQAEAGGLWLQAGEDAVRDLKAFGFGLVSRATNHAMDFGAGGLIETDRLLAAHGIAFAGTGATRAAALAPAYVTTRAGRTALVSVTDTAPVFARASHARHDMRGRPGANVIRVHREREVDEATFDALVLALTVSSTSGAPIGRVSPDGRVIHGLGAPIHRAAAPGDRFELTRADVEENLAQIRAARRRADCVVFALHTHLCERDQARPPAAVRAFARAAIDAGADVVVGHGPHRLRGVEIYRGRPIFHSLGNFVSHLHKAGPQPADLYEQLGWDPLRATVDDLYAEGTMTAAMLEAPWQWESVVARVVHDGPARRRVELHPIVLSSRAAGARRGTPARADAADARRIIARLAELSAPLGAAVAYEDGIGVLEYDLETPDESDRPSSSHEMSAAVVSGDKTSQ